jgi:hypothetical protein
MLRSGSLLSRSLALVLMLGATVTLYEFALMPVIGAHSRARAKIEQTNALLQRYHALAEQRTRLADQISAYERIVADTDAYLPGRNDIEAAAALQEWVKSAIEGAHGELRSTQVLPAQAVETKAPLRLIALRIEFKIDINGLQNVLYALETSDPYLFIEKLGIQRHDAPDPGSALDVSLTIEGYANGGATAAVPNPDASTATRTRPTRRSARRRRSARFDRSG